MTSIDTNGFDDIDSDNTENGGYDDSSSNAVDADANDSDGWCGHDR